MIMIPSFMVIGILTFKFIFSQIEMSEENWFVTSVSVGVIIMDWQFTLDLIFLVFLAGGGISYFFALVTISYLLIPLWDVLTGKYLINKEN